MKLQLKLFLFLGTLLLVICLAIYFVPLYVAHRQRQLERKNYFHQLSIEQDQIWQENFNFIAGEMGRLEGDVDAFLIFAHNSPFVLADLIGAKYEAGPWLPGLRLLSFTSQMDSLQIESALQPPAVIAMTNFEHYWAYQQPIDDHLSWVTFSSRQWYDPVLWYEPWFLPTTLEQKSFLGLRLPTREAAEEPDFVFEKEKEPSDIFLLFDPAYLYGNQGIYQQLLDENKSQLDTLSLLGIPQAGKMMENLLTQLVQAQGYLAKTFKNQASLEEFLKQERARVRLVKTEFPLEEGAIGVRTEAADPEAERLARKQFFTSFVFKKTRVRALNMAKALALYSSMGVVWTSPNDPSAAIGAARIEPGSQQGGGILTHSIFLDQRVFNAKELLLEYPPSISGIPFSSGFGLIGNVVGYQTIANAMRFPIHSKQGTMDGYLTAGAGMMSITNQLGILTNLPVILMAHGKAADWTGLTGQPTPVRPFLAEVEGSLSKFSARHGFIDIAGEQFYYARYQPRADWDLYYLTFTPAGEVQAPYQLFEAQADRLRHKVSTAILIFAGAVFVIAILLLQWIARRFTRPLTQLAQVTEEIGAGRIEQVVLPEASDRDHNEVHLLTRSFGSMVNGLQERNKMRSVLDKVVSKEIADEILKGKVELGGALKEVTVLFADIRGFTKLSERLTPDETITFVNHFMTEMTHLIEEHHGVIDKYIGDEIMALFGAPIALEESPLRAIEAALGMIKRLRTWNTERKARGEFPIEIGIGINHGEVIVGNVGAEDRLNYTVIGTNVNIGARLCDIAKPMEVLMPKAVADRLPHVRCVNRGTVRLRGFSQPIEICSVEGISNV